MEDINSWDKAKGLLYFKAAMGPGKPQTIMRGYKAAQDDAPINMYEFLAKMVSPVPTRTIWLEKRDKLIMNDYDINGFYAAYAELTKRAGITTIDIASFFMKTHPDIRNWALPRMEQVQIEDLCKAIAIEFHGRTPQENQSDVINALKLEVEQLKGKVAETERVNALNQSQWRDQNSSRQDDRGNGRNNQRKEHGQRNNGWNKNNRNKNRNNRSNNQNTDRRDQSQSNTNGQNSQKGTGNVYNVPWKDLKEFKDKYCTSCGCSPKCEYEKCNVRQIGAIYPYCGTKGHLEKCCIHRQHDLDPQHF